MVPGHEILATKLFFSSSSSGVKDGRNERGRQRDAAKLPGLEKLLGF